VANTKSAAKRAKQADARNLRNRSCITRVRTSVKNFRASVQSMKEGKITKEEAQKMLSAAQSLLQKAVSKGVLHKNNASRRIQRLAHLLAK
jgi:small subunit ribosomal protein S20